MNDKKENKKPARRLTQRERLAIHFKKFGSVTTIYAREHMGILGVAPRVLELKAGGMNIGTYWKVEVGVDGQEHEVANYVYFSHGGMEGE